MKIMVGDKTFTQEDGPMVIHLTEQDRRNIANMVPDATCYMVFDQEKMTIEEARDYIKAAADKLND